MLKGTSRERSLCGNVCFNQENDLETVISKVQELIYLSVGTKMKQVRYLPWRQNIRGTKNFSNQEK